MHVSASGGVIDHNTFVLVGWIFGIYGFNGGGSYGDAAWAEATDLGTGNRAFFIEDNVFEATERSFALDGWKGQRVVVRHNTFKNALIGNHGTESSGRLRGARSFEIYDNVIQYTGTTWPDAISFRSGTGVVFNNQVTGNFKEAMRVDNYRDWRSFSPWGIASGESPFDKNDVDDRGKPIVYDTGTHTGDQGVAVLTCAGKKWAADQWQGYSVFNITTGKSSIITSNTETTFVAPSTAATAAQILPGTRATDSRLKGVWWHWIRWARQGKLDFRRYALPAAWPEQVADPTYVWNNTLNGRAGKLVSGSPRVKDGVDFFNGIPKPDYTPYAYPHPLVGK